MKKFLSVLLAVMMVLSTVSFAVPSAVGTMDTAVEMPVVEAVAEATDAELAADSTVDEFGTLLAEINFDSLELGEYTFETNNQTLVGSLGGTITADSGAALTHAKLCNGSGGSYPALGAVVKEKADGNKYIEFTTNTNANYNLLQLWTGASSHFFAKNEGYLTLTFDVNYGSTSASGDLFNVAFNRSQQAEASDQNEIITATPNGGWGRVISTFDEEQAGISGIGGNSATMTSATMVNYVKIHLGGGVKTGETFGIDNIRLYWRPKTVDVTIDVEGGEDIVLNDYDTLGTPMAELAAMLPAVENKILTGFSLEKDGELLSTTKFASDCTIYPVYEERVILSSSIEFNDASDASKYTVRQGSNNALGANLASIENGVLKLTFTGTDKTKVVQDTGLNNIKVNAPAGVVTNIEIKARFTGMPTTTTTLSQASGGTRTYNPTSVNFPQLYYTTGGVFSTYGEKILSDLSDANNNWKIFNYTAEELGITDLTTVRLDMYDFMPHGSTLEIDYIRFIGRPVRVTVDNGANKSAPAVKMDLTKTTTVAEVEAKYAKDHGDMKFVGLSRTPGGAVLASTELVSADGAATTLYAVWDNYEYITKYSVDFNEEADVNGGKIRVVQNNDGVDGESTYGKTYFWNEAGYLTLKAVAADGYTATWDQQVFVNAFSPATAVPAGVISEIAVRMRYRNLPTTKGTYTVPSRADTAFDPANNAAYVHIAKYGATKWGELLQSNNRGEKNLVDGEWFTRYLDAETYFAEGLAYVRFDTAYPLPNGVEVDIDYIRFVGDNEDENLPGSEFLGEFGEKIFEVNFDSAATGDYASGSNITSLGANINSWLNPTDNNVSLTVSGAQGVIEQKSATDKYLTYTLGANGNSSHTYFNASKKSYTNEDGYFIVTYDYKTTSAVEWPFTFRMNEQNLVEEQADNHYVIDNGEWKKVVLFYDNEIGTGTNKSGEVITSNKEISIIKWHPTVNAKAGETVSIDNFTLWFVPKTVDVTIDLSAYDKDNVVIKDYPTNGMDDEDLALLLPTVAGKSLVGLSATEDGEEVYQNRTAVNATFYPVYENVNLLAPTLEFNGSEDIARISAMSDNAFRMGRNNAFTYVAEQYKLVSEGNRSFLRMENNSVKGENGAVIDYGFWTTNALPVSEIKEIVMNIRIAKWAAAGTYVGDDRLPNASFNPEAMQFQFYFMDAEGKTVKKQITPVFNAKALGGEWFKYTIPASEIPADAELLRFDPPDVVAHGTVIDVDYIRFYGEPIPDAEKRSYSADFDTDETGISLVSWKKEDGTYMVDDGVNGDYGVGTGSAFIGNADDYITWNEDGYVTLNFVANDEVKATAAEKGATAFVYDASAYIAALDGAKYLPAGSFTEMKMRMRFRDLPADGTALYGLAYSNWQDHTWNLNDPSNYFYFHYSNVKGGVKYDGATATKQSYDDIKIKGTYDNNAWFEVTIPASYFKADENPLEILRLNIPNYMPDGAKLDIDYIHFYGDPIVVEAPVSLEEETAMRVEEGKDNGVRFKATMTSEANNAAATIGWAVVSYDKFMAGGTQSYDNLTVDTTGAIVAYQRLDGEDLVNFFDESNDAALIFAATLKNIPEDHFDSYFIVRPFISVEGGYLYGTAFSTSLYEEAVAIYESAAYDDLTIEQQDYILYVMDTVEL